MPFNDQDENKKDTSFISEKIKQRPINRKKLLRRTIITASMAVVFGLVSCLTFLLLQPLLSDRLYPESQPENISLPEESASDELTPEEMFADDTEIAENEAQQNEENQKNQLDEALASYAFNGSDFAKIMTSSLKDVADEASKSIVRVTGVANNTDWFNDSFENNGASGVIVADNGAALFILVPSSAVKNAKNIRVTFNDESMAEAEMCLTDNITKLCVITVKLSSIQESTKETIKTADFANTNFTNLTATPVIAIGSPTGIQRSVSIGLITSDKSPLYLGDSNYKIITTDMPGSSDSTGALIDLNGKLLGIIDMNYNSDENKKNRKGLENHISAIAITELRNLIEDLSNKTQRAYFGIYGKNIPAAIRDEMNMPQGAFVTSTEETSPARKALIQSGDIITKLDDNDIISFDAFVKKLADYSPDDIISVTVMRQSNKGYTEIKTQVTLESATHD